MRKFMMIIGIMLISVICLNAQKYQLPSEIKKLFPKDGSMIRVDDNVRAVFEKHKAELQKMEYDCYLMARNNKGPNNSMIETAPFYYMLICNRYQCNGWQWCPDSYTYKCVWWFGCQNCSGQTCPNCGRPFDIYNDCWIGMCWPL